eukprot:NODE_814_length_1322_cov_430.470542_g569_i1.p1 GENE.NODE_814_length_1322_cov_430.470542_g569_i1~~NODE_814_length_1322_cov_430.470542_g569_i1.p1  ORF type:complete len:335 (-),score=56.62 NODE_814_length_1322_cov_430.470542_g569_i1:291-1295(-)
MGTVATGKAKNPQKCINQSESEHHNTWKEVEHAFRDLLKTFSQFDRNKVQVFSHQNMPITSAMFSLCPSRESDSDRRIREIEQRAKSVGGVNALHALLQEYALLGGTDAKSVAIGLTSVKGAWHREAFGIRGLKGVGTSHIKWGKPWPPNKKQSGFEFTPVAARTIQSGKPFMVGVFTHHNWPVTGSTDGELNLKVTMELAQFGKTAKGTFNYVFNFEETPNNEDVCKYGNALGKGCNDHVVIKSGRSLQTFKLNGTEYTVDLRGFRRVGGGATSQLINALNTGESADSKAELWAAIVPPSASCDICPACPSKGAYKGKENPKWCKPCAPCVNE